MKGAYISLLYGNTLAFLDAVVFAASLRSTAPKYCLDLLYDNDVPAKQLEVLSSYYDNMLKVAPIQVKEGIISEKCPSRLERILEKLHALALTQYDKVLMCDTDMLVIRNIDSLFEFRAPAAMALDEDFIRTANVYLSSERALARYEKGQSYINAGIMLLRPDQSDFLAACNALANDTGTRATFILPDQDFLSGFYAHTWHSIPYLYNFRPCDIVSPYSAYLKKLILETSIENVSVVHYAGTDKPGRYLQWTQDETNNNRFEKGVLAAIKGEDGGGNQRSDPEVQLYSELMMMWIKVFLCEYSRFFAVGIDLLKLCNERVD
jgi:hypothetical protein